MEGKDIINLINSFIKETEVDVNRFLYDGNVFGNYDIVFHYKKISLTLNCDRGFLSVLVSDIHKKSTPVDYFKILTKISDIHKYNCNFFSDHEHLEEILSVICRTIDLVQEYYLIKIQKKSN